MSDNNVPLICTNCGSSQFAMPEHRPLADGDVVTCGGCQRESTVGALRQQALEAAKKLVADRFKNLFKK